MLSDMLFENTHSVEQLVDIKKKKKVDKVLLKVIKTIRSRTGISDWIKPESDLKKDFDISDKAIASICDVLNEYYQVTIEPQYTGTVKDMVQYIKCHQQTAADSIFLVDSATLDIDENNDTAEEPDVTPEAGESDEAQEPKENLEVDPKVVSKSEPSTSTDEKVPSGVDASTENMITNLFGMIANTVKSVWKGNSYATKQAQEFFINRYDKVIEFINKTYGKDSKDKTKHNFVFEDERPLWGLDTIVALYEKTRRQFEFISKIPVYSKAEDLEEVKKDPVYEEQLRKYLPKRMIATSVPEKEKMSYSDAGYLNSHEFKRAYQYWSSGFMFYYTKALKNLNEVEVHYPGAVSYLKKMGVFDVVPPSKIKGDTAKGSRKLNKRYIWAFAWMNDVTAMFKYLKSDISQFKTDTEEKEKKETMDSLREENAKLRKENEEHVYEKVAARKKAEAEAAAKNEQDDKKEESAQESYSVENMQVNIPKTDEDWGSLLNSF